MRSYIDNPHLLDQVRAFTDESGIERCGLIFEFEEKLVLWEVRNAHEDPVNHYGIQWEDANKLLSGLGWQSLRLVFHTHIKAVDTDPSPHDVAQLRKLRFKWPFLMGMVYNVPLGLLVEFSDKGPMRRLLLADRRNRS